MNIVTLHFLLSIGLAAVLAYLFYAMMLPEDLE